MKKSSKNIPMVTKLKLTKERENTCLPFTEEIPTICDTTSIVSLYWFVGGIRLRNKKNILSGKQSFTLDKNKNRAVCSTSEEFH